MNYGKAECEITADGSPPPRCGNVFVAVHGGRTRPGDANDRNLYELYDFSITLTMRVVVPMDRLGDQLIARNLAIIPLARRQGFNAKVEQLRAYLHMNWRITVMTGQTPNSANDNLTAWSDDSISSTVYGFVEPARYQGADLPSLVGGEWMGAAPDSEDFAIKSELRFTGAKRFQPQTASVGVFM